MLPDFALFLERPIAFFDIEATGVDVTKDRIVSIYIDVLYPDGQRQSKEWRCNPGFEMSAEVVAIHGITNEAVKDCPPFKEQARGIYSAIRGCDLGGFNLLNFDVPLLWEEFHRAGIKWSLRGVEIIDVGNIFKKKEERTLSAGVRFYCGREHTGAHSADADVRATIDVLDAQLKRYSDLNGLPVSALAKFSQFDDRVDLAGKIVRNKDGEPVYSFGNSKGVRVKDDPGFARWMLGKDFSENTKQALRSILYPQQELV
jgi:DNA polymerase-3 subunit epsilon